MLGFHVRTGARLCSLSLALAASLSAHSASAALTYVFESSVLERVPGVLEDTVTGVDMRDMQVTVLRTDGETDTRTWGASTAGRAVGVGWSLNFGTGETDVDAWAFANSLSHAPVRSITLEGKPGRVLFDVDMYNLDGSATCAQYAPSGGAPLACSAGSGQGRRFNYESNDFTALVTYSDPVALGRLAPVGDLFYTMTIEFPGRGMGASVFSFFQDTDLAARSAVPPPSAVPLPTAAPLLGAALLALLGLGDRRARPRSRA